MYKDAILEHRWSATLVQKMLLWKNYSAYKELTSYRNAGLFEYERFVRDYPRFFTDPIPDNCCWGMMDCLKQYTGMKSINAYIEHGYFWGSFVPEIEEKCFAKRIVTFSNHRKNYISQKCSKDVIPIGPYIHYAPDYLSESESISLKNELGKVLLFVPTHAGTGMTLKYSIGDVMNRISSISNSYDTKIVSLFWTDAIQGDVVNTYIKEGFKVFCAGHRYDPFFLMRQKSILKLSDLIVCNGEGTHIGYGAYLNKPIWVIKQHLEKQAVNATGRINISFDEKVREDQKKEIEYVTGLFTEYKESLTLEQKNSVGELFGFESIKDKDSLKKILG